MKALVTGASSGIGKEIAIYLDKLGYEVILVARNKEKLESVAKTLTHKPKIIVMDLQQVEDIKSLYVLVKNDDIDILVNNAGFGLCGNFTDIELSKELEMIDINIKAVHILTKLFLKDMKRKNRGYILNVASSAAFESGPLMATYYSTKSYIYRLTEAINYELKKEKVNVHVSCLCPGPVDTNFNNVANVKFSVKPLKADYVAKYAVDKMFNNKMLIIPGLKMKLAKFFGRFLSDKALMRMTYRIQRRKIK
ncbi:MAG: SDR family oxidoreductase [Tenericutes bacterium]|nr:SDR family oxidoreductase [Mycoplasmatota bacterium]